MKTAMLWVAPALLAGCANGDGRGFATVSGTLQVAFGERDFEAEGGGAGEVTGFTVTIARVAMEAHAEVGDQLETRTATFPVGTSVNPLEPGLLPSFGPFEIDRGEFDTLSLTITRVVVEGEVDGEDFTITAVPAGGIRLEAPADLPVDDEKAPNIALTMTTVVDAAILEGLDPTAEGTADEIAARIAELGRLQASWSRKND